MAIDKDFLLAGRAVFTIEQPDGAPGNPHYTFRIKRKDASGQYPEAWFISMLTGPDNQHSYSYVGMLDPVTGAVRLTKKSKYGSNTRPVALLGRVLARLFAGEGAIITAAGYTVHHEGKCARCGRPLTVPSSIESGIGPECAKVMSEEFNARWVEYKNEFARREAEQEAAAYLTE